MVYVTRLLCDIFSTEFDVILPLSACIAAPVLALVLFLVRYLTYRHRVRRFARGAEPAPEQALQVAAAAVPGVQDVQGSPAGAAADLPSPAELPGTEPPTPAPAPFSDAPQPAEHTAAEQEGDA